MKLVSLLFAAAFLMQTNVSAATEPNNTVAEAKEKVSIQSRTISGIVSDRKGQPLVGATVKQMESMKNAASTDIDGKFTLKNIPDSCTLQVSYIGFIPQEVTVTPDKDEYSIIMRVNHSVLDEVVVVGYATQKKVLSRRSE